MSHIKHPKKPGDITSEWMNYAFSEAGLCKSGSISAIDVQPLGTSVQGLLSSLCRVAITYEAKKPELPDSVIIKFPSELEENKNFASNIGAYERELRFYRELAARSPIRVPECYYNVIDEKDDNYILVLEDAGSWTQGDQLRGLTADQTRSAVKAISGFHGYWWGSPELEKLGWIPENNLDLIHSFRDNWEEFSTEHKEILSDKDIAAGDLIARSGKRIHDLSLLSPRTIIHYDFRADNMMFNEKDEIMVLDWQLANRSFGAFDIVRAVCGSHHGELEKRHHMEFLNLWHEGLMESGVQSYTIDEAWNDYRLGIICLSYIPVVIHHLLSHEGSRGISVLRARVKRIFYAIHECRALETIL